MKKHLRLSLLSGVVLALMLMATTAPALGAGLTLVSVTSKGSRGLILTFEAGSEYTGATGGTATVGWRSYPMYCGMAGSGKLVCYIGSGIFKHAGKTALVSIGGQTFSVGIPAGGGKPLPWWYCLEFPEDPRCDGVGGG